MTLSKIASLTLVALIALPVAAQADNAIGLERDDTWHDSRLSSGYGISTILGGGLTGFTDKTMRNTMSSDVGGLWDLRVTLGSHTPLAIDVGYIGTAASIDALSRTQSGTLVGTTFEAAARWNIRPRAALNPYVFAGMGWQRYDISGGSFKQSDTGMNDSDNSIVFPMGAGVSYRDPTGLVADLKGTFRANTGAGLVLESLNSTNHAAMHTWEASAAVGYEF